MNSFQKNALFLVSVLFVAVTVSAISYLIYQSHKQELAEQRLAWEKENIRSLKDLNRIGTLSTEEQTRLDNAGDDVDRIQQVLLDLHTERHTYWVSQLQEIKDKEQQISSNSYLAAYDPGGQFREAELELRKRQVEVQGNLSGFELGLRRIRAWRPQTFEQFRSGQLSVTAHSDGQISSPQNTAEAFDSTPKPQAGILEPLTPIVASQPITVVPVTPPSVAQNSLDGVDVEVSRSLKVWSNAMLSNDPQEVANSYATHVDRYFLKLDIDNEAVKKYMTDWEDRGSKKITGFSVKDITIENESSDVVKLRLIKDMTISDSSGTNEHIIRSRLYLRRENGEWKITSEQDFK